MFAKNLEWASLSPLDIIYYTLIIGKCQVVILHKLSLEFLCRVHKSRIPAVWNVRGRAKKIGGRENPYPLSQGKPQLLQQLK